MVLRLRSEALMITDNDKHSSDMKEQRLDILQKVANGELTTEQAETKLLGLSIVGKSLRDFTDDDILDEIDADMNYWCVPQGEIESMRQDWRNRFLILRRER